MRRVGLLLLLLAVACSPNLPHEGAFDEKSPLSKQARANLAGTVTLQGETDFSQISVQLINASRTYNVDTQANGSIELTGIVPGTYELRIGTRYFEAITETIVFGLAEQKTLSTRALAPLRSGVLGNAISEILVDGALVPTGGVTLTLLRTGSVRGGGTGAAPKFSKAAEGLPTSYTTESSSNGAYEFEEVPAGQYDLTAETPESGETQVGTVTVTGEGDVTVDEVVLRPLSGFFEIVGLVNGEIDNRYTQEGAVTLHLTSGSARDMKIAVSTTGNVAGCPLATTPKELFRENTTLDLGSVEGAKLVCVVFLDADGKETKPSLGTIIYDKTPPILPSVRVNNGAAVVNNRLVTLSLSAVDEISGLDNYNVAAINDFSLLSPLPFQFNTVHSLPDADGEHTVWVRFGDKAGNYSVPASTSVFLDRAAPVENPGTRLTRLDRSIVASDSTLNDGRVIFISDVSDLTLIEMQVTTSGSFSGIAWEPYTPEKSLTLTSAASTISVRVRDQAGFITNLVSGFIVNLDTSIPTATLTRLTGTPSRNLFVGLSLSSSEGSSNEGQVSGDPGFEGAVWQSVGAITGHTLSAGDGLRTVYGRVRDAAGNVSAIVVVSTLLDTLPPENPSFTIAQASPTNDDSLDLTLTASGATQMSVAEGTCSAVWEPYAQSKVFSLAVSASVDADYTVAVRFRDAAGNETADCLTRTLRFDNRAPQVLANAVVINNFATASSNATVTLTFSVLGATQVKVSEDIGLGDAVWLPYTPARSFGLSAGNGLKLVYALFRDDAGNEAGPANDAINLDTTPVSTPIVTLESEVSNATTLNVGLAAASVDEMFLSHTQDFSAGTGWVPFVSTTSYTFPSGDGVKTLYGKFRKFTGGETRAGDSYILDTAAPTLSSVRVNNGATVVAGDIVTINLSAVDATSGLLTYKVNTVNDFSASPAQAYQANDVYTLVGLDGAKTLWVVFGDRAGNYGAPVSTTVLLDRAAPVLMSTSFELLDGTAVAANAVIKESRIRLVSNVTDLSTLEMQVSTTGTFAGLGWESYSSGKMIDLPGGISPVSARVRDQAGFVTNLISGFSVNVDNFVPVATLARLTATPTNIRFVGLSLSSNEGANDGQVSEDPGFEGATWQAAASITGHSLTAGDGVRTIYGRVRDAAGNISALKTVSVNLDQTPPLGADFAIVSGAFTPLRTVSLSYSGVDIVEARTAEGACGGTFATHAGAGTVSLTSPGDGLKTVSVQFRDAIGNETGCLSKTVTLDETKPIINTALSINGGASETRLSQVTVVAGVTGATEMQLSENIAFAGAAWVPYAVTSQVLLSSGDAAKTLYARYRDAAGNISDLDAASIWLDTTPPGNVTLAIVESSPTRLATVTLTAAAEGTPAFMQLSENIGFVGASSIPFDPNPSFLLGAGDGQHTIYLRVSDSAGNWSALASASLVVDTAIPLYAGFDILSGAYTKSASASIALIVSGADSFQAINDVFCGGAWNAITAATSVSLGGPDGLKSISVRYRDNAGNESVCLTKTVTLDTALPGGSMVLNGGVNDANSRTMIVTLTADEPVDMQLSESALFGDASWRPFTAATEWTFSSGEGARSLYGRLRDRAGNLSATLNDGVSIDTVAPTDPAVTLAGGLSMTNLPAVSIVAAATGASHVRVSNTAAFAASPWIAYPASITWHPLTAGDGLKTVYAQFKDVAGNLSAVVSDNIVKDTVAPNNEEIDVAGSSPTRLTTVNLILSAAGADEVRVGGDIAGGATAWLSGRTNLSVSLSAGDGVKTISAQWRDLAGNYSATVTTSVTLDQTDPGNGTLAINAAELTNSPSVTLSLTSSGATEMILSNDSSFVGGTWEPVAASKSWTLSAGDSTKFVYLKYRDAAGNESDPINDTIVLDTQPPTSASFTIFGSSTSTQTITLNLSAGGASEVRTGNDPSFAASAWRSYAGSVTHALPAGDGLKVVYVKYRDAAGNESATLSQVIQLDTGAPTGPQLVLNGGTEFTQVAGVTLNLSAAGANEMAFSNDGFAFSSWEPYAPVIGYTLPGGDGTKVVYVKFRDGALNETVIVSDSITLDTQVPTGTSIQIAGGANYTRSASVVLTLAATGASEMQLSEDNSFSGVSWEPLSVNRVFVLSTGEGAKLVHARFRDPAGWITTFVSDGITYDATPPAGNTLIVNSGAAGTNSRTLNMVLTTNDGLAEMRLSENSDFSGAAWVPFATPVTYWLSAGEGTKALYLQLRDPAGNETGVLSRFIQLDTQAPIGAGILVNNNAAYAKAVAVILTVSGVGATEMIVSENAAFLGATWVPFTTTYAHTITGGDGLRSVYLRLRDDAGNYSGTVNDAIQLDTDAPTAPGITIAEKPATRTTRVTLTLTAVGATEMILGDDAAFTGRSWQPIVSPTAWSLPPGEGSHPVYAKFRDNAGNETVTVSDATLLDTAVPTLQNPPVQIEAGASYIRSEIVNITVRYVDAVSAAVGEDIAVAFPVTYVTLPGGGVETFQATLSAGEGLKNVYIKFFDAAGNSIVQGATVFLDKTAPLAGQIAIDNGAAYNTSAIGAATLALSASDAGSGLARVRISNTNADADLDGATPVAFLPSKAWTLASSGSGLEGTRTVFVKFIDAAGNESPTIYADDIGYDTQAPQAGAWSLQIGNSEYSASLSNTLQIAATGATEMRISADSLFNGAAYEPFATSRMWTFGSGGDGVTQTLNIKFRDAAGNETAFYSDSITIDTQAPNGLSMSLDGGAEYGGVPQSAYTRDEEFTVTLGASSWTLAEVSDDVGFQNVFASFNPAAVFPQTVQLPVSNRADGLKTIFARFRDGAGNFSPIISRLISLDTTKPSPVSVLINGGVVATQNVTGIMSLTLSAGDAGSGIDKMRFGNTLFDLNAASLEPFNGSKTWTLDDVGANIEGLRTVYFQVTDRAGNQSDAVSDDILYDTLPPQPTMTPIQFIGFWPGTQLQPSQSRTTDVFFQINGASEMMLGSDSNFNGRSWEPYSGVRSWTFSEGGDNAARTIFAVFRDQAGNQTLLQQADFYIDDVAPTAPSITLTGGMEYDAMQGCMFMCTQTGYTRNDESYLTLSASSWSIAELSPDPGFGWVSGAFPFGTSMPQSYNLMGGMDGAQSLYARFVDAAGNRSAVVSASIVKDSFAPILQSLFINGHDVIPNYYNYNPVSPWAVTSTTGEISVQAQATDMGFVASGVSKILISEMGPPGVAEDFNPQPKAFVLNNPGPNQMGNRNVNVTVFDAAGNSVNTSATIMYRTMSPILNNPIITDAQGNNIFAMTSLNGYVTLSQSSEVSQYQISEDPTFSGAAWTTRVSLDPYYPYYNDPLIAPFTLAVVPPVVQMPYSSPPPPARRVYMRGRDFFGNTSEIVTVNPNQIYVDLVPPPTPTITLARTYVPFSTIDFSFTVPANPDNDTEVLEVSSSPLFQPMWQTKNIWVGSATSGNDNFNFTANGDGNYTIYFRMKDMAGNYSPVIQKSVIVDMMPPMIQSVVLNDGAAFAKSTTFNFKLTAEDPVPFNLATPSGLAKIAFSSNGWDCMSAGQTPGEWVDYAPEVNFTPPWLAFAPDGIHTIHVCVLDKADVPSNWIQTTIEIDRLEPQGGVFEPSSGAATTSSMNITLKATTTEFFAADVQIANEPLFIGAVWQPTGASIPWTLTSGDGSKTVYARFRDQAGNVTAVPFTTTLLFDSTPPVPGSLVLNSGAAIVNTTDIDFTLSASETLSLPMTMQFSSDPGFAGAAWVAYATSGVQSIPAGDGYRSLFVRFRDAMGNVSPASAGSFILDQTGPNLSYLLVNGGNSYASSSLPVQFQEGNWSAGDVLWVSNSASFTIYSEFAVNAGNNVASFGLSGSDGNYTLYIKAKDTLGNFGPVYTAAVTKDTAAPTLTGKAVVLDGDVDFTTLPYALAAFNVADANEMMLSNNAAFSGASWEPMRATAFWFLDSGNGMRTIYAKFRDSAGNQAGPYSDAITVDTAPPEAPGLALQDIDADGYSVAADRVELQWTLPGDPNLSGFTLERYVSGIDPGFTAVASFGPAVSSYLAYVTATTGRRHEYRIRAFDLAGNVSAWSVSVSANPFAPLSSVYWIREYNGYRFDFWPSGGTFSMAPLRQYYDINSALFTQSLPFNQPGWNRSDPSVDINEALVLRQSNQDNSLVYESQVPLRINERVIVDAPFNVGQYSSIATDTAGKAYIAYADSTNGYLKLATNATGAWVISTLDATGFMKEGVSLVMDKNGKLHVSYYSMTCCTTYALKYGTNTSGSWVLTNVDTISGTLSGYSSLGIDSAGKIHIAYTASGAGDLRRATNATGVWLTELVDGVGNVGHMPSLAVDAADNIHVAYSNQGGGTLKYAKYSVGAWVLSTIDSSAIVGEYPSLRIDKYGFSHISYYNGTAGDLRYITNASGLWVVDTIDATDSVGTDTSLIFDGDGAIHISYYDSTNGALKHATNRSGSWVLQTLDTAGNAGRYSSIAVDKRLNLHVSYTSETASDSDLKYAFVASGKTSYRVDNTGSGGNYIAMAVDTDGASYVSYQDPNSGDGDLKFATNVSGDWVTTTLDTANNTGYETSIAVDSAKKVHIMYHESWSQDLWYATNASGSWVYENLDATGNTGHRASVVIGAGDKVHVSYYNGSPTARIHYRTNASGVWVDDIFDPLGIPGTTSLALDAAGKAHIAYYTQMAAGDLKYATNASGSWVVTSIDSAGDVGDCTSLKVDAQGSIHISYCDTTNGDLKYATNRTGAWIVTTLDSLARVSFDTSLGLDANGKVHIAYYDWSNFDLKYVTNAPGTWTRGVIDSAGDVGQSAALTIDAAGNIRIAYRDFVNTAPGYRYLKIIEKFTGVLPASSVTRATSW